MYAILIMDGFAYAPEGPGNAIRLAGTPNLDRLTATYPHTTLGASGLDVGLPDGQMGNSEVGHVNIGAGRIVYQELTRITKEIETGEFDENEAINRAIQQALDTGKSLHIYGLLSDGGVHSHNSHLYALLALAKKRKLDRVFVHCFMDGRDVSPTSGKGYIEALQQEMDRLGVGKIATVVGRYYAMDRDNRWERVEKAYDAMTLGTGNLYENAAQAVQASYDADVTDEFIQPIVLTENGKMIQRIEEGDSIICFNFRPDRAREITRAFTESTFAGFERKSGYIAPCYVCFTQYDASFTNVSIAFHAQSMKNTLGEYLSTLGKKQLRIAETEKYAHVTFFFNGGIEAQYSGEDRILVPSPKVATYDLQPEMSIYEVTEKAIDAIHSGKYDVMILNFANCDMVGHTGVISAAVRAVKAVDECMGKLTDAILAVGGCALITADHGNADKLLDENGGMFTAHTTNRVPLIAMGKEWMGATLSEGVLADIAPTLLDMMHCPIPKEMTGHSLIKK